jgi:hypothetical protein
MQVAARFPRRAACTKQLMPPAFDRLIKVLLLEKIWWMPKIADLFIQFPRDRDRLVCQTQKTKENVVAR